MPSDAVSFKHPTDPDATKLNYDTARSSLFFFDLFSLFLSVPQSYRAWSQGYHAGGGAIGKEEKN